MQNTPPAQPSSDNSAPGGAPPSDSATVTYNAATEYSNSSAAELLDETYTSDLGGQNALLVSSGATVILTNPTITKSGDESSESSDFYGTNAAVLAADGQLSIDGGSITTSGSHANAVFSYGEGNIVVKNTTITTSANNSGGIMVTGGGTLTANDVTVTTSGNSSAAIRSDRGGGTMTITGGSYSTSGVGSPAVYSTANISVSGAELTSTASEGVVIEGSNSVTLSGVTLVDTNTTLNGNSETYKNIFIYQSMSGDAEEGTGTFSAQSSTLTTNQGDSFYVTNTTAKIALSNNVINNADSTGAFLRAESSKWGTTGANGGHVTLDFSNQVAEGDIVLDSISTLSFTLSNSSFFRGAINTSSSAQSVSLKLDATSTFVLTADTYLTSLDNADSANSNIYSAGHTLYVNGVAVATNTSTAPATPEVSLTTSASTFDATEPVVETSSSTSSSASSPDYLPYLIAGGAGLGIILVVVLLVIFLRKNKAPKTPASPIQPASASPFPPQPLDSSSLPPVPPVNTPPAFPTNNPPVPPAANSSPTPVPNPVTPPINDPSSLETPKQPS